MSAKVKTGDLAYIIGGQYNVGRVVQVHGFDASWKHPCGIKGCWECTCPSGFVNTNGWKITIGMVPESWLRPIGGVPMQDEILDEIMA